MKKIVFVYNADTGLFNKVTDFAHKILSPQTYACNLCTLTYNSMNMKHDWKEFLESLHYSTEFLYKNQFQKKWDMGITFPAVLIINDVPEILLSSEDINKCKDLDALKSMLKNKLNAV